ncbi:FAD-dependent oxidoreductase [Amycolatopsis alkalitolerans]|uniref:FAD-binding protein n=1 Tax=Amycolatopsis alkalitolerans TaxID=2547244 RepID=A0A5C4LUG7_9PSEU|nr:FAD-dependent oxidoreductase [Amycolatopsis alkalitolerans]TNC22405.1 FAD-binding protein [Amycolatopsis alkalitolerans]
MTDVLVAGGGIGGLSAAYALATAGYSVRLLERSAEFGEVGAGLQLAPNATRILREWGLLDEIAQAGVLPRRLVLADAVSGDELVHAELTGEFKKRYHAPYVVVHRSDLHRILVEACRRAGVTLETGRTVERVDSTEDTAFTYCADGSVFESQIAVAADGLTSKLRRAVADDEPICSGYVAYRGAVPAEEASTAMPLDDVVAWIGPRCHLVQYGLRRGELVNRVAVFASPAYERGETDWGGPDELEEAFAGCGEHVRRSLSSLWRDRRWPMYDRIPVENWVSGRLVLTGDAAHPMLQYLAQGACQAIEDAHTLAAEAVKGEDWGTALAAFNSSRASRTARVQRTARTWGDIWHVDGVGRLLRNELMTSLAEVYRHTDWLYA